MKIHIASLLGLVMLASEVGLAIFKRADRGDARLADAGSLRLLWIVIGVSVVAGFALHDVVPAAAMPAGWAVKVAGVVLFLTGVAVRWYSIVYLGRLFTVDVAIAADHRLVDGGPYRWVRHPSYAGALLAFAGLSLCLGNWASLIVLTVPTSLAFLRRIRVEEQALTAALGDSYRDYMARTKRLFPTLY